MNLVHSAVGNTGCVCEESNSDGESLARVFPFEKKSVMSFRQIITCCASITLFCTKAACGEKWYLIFFFPLGLSVKAEC